MKKSNTPPIHSMSAEEAIEIGKRAVCYQFSIDPREIGEPDRDLMAQALQRMLEKHPERHNFQDALKFFKSLRAHELDPARQAQDLSFVWI